MTNPNPQFSVQCSNFDSASTSINRGSHGSNITLVQDSKFENSLLSPETEVVVSSSSSSNPAAMDAKVSPDGSSAKIISVTSAIKKASGDDAGTTSSSAVQRKVGFVLNDKKRILEEVFDYPACPRYEQQYTDEELDEMLTDAMLVARDFSRNRKDWQNKIKFLLKGCSNRDIKTEKPTPLKGEDLDFVVDCEARGLELYIHPIFQKSREKAIRSVVKVQKDYNASEEAKGTTNPELRVKVLRGQSMKYTQAARLLAKTLASGDTRAASKNIDEEETTQTDEEEESGTAAAGDDVGRSGMRNNGLQDLRKQHASTTKQSQQPGAGGIGSLQVALDDLTDARAAF